MTFEDASGARAADMAAPVALADDAPEERARAARRVAGGDDDASKTVFVRGLHVKTTDAVLRDQFAARRSGERLRKRDPSSKSARSEPCSSPSSLRTATWRTAAPQAARPDNGNAAVEIGPRQSPLMRSSQSQIYGPG